MAWPRDARHTVFGALQQVLDSFLNEMQDQIISINSEREKIFKHWWDEGATLNWTTSPDAEYCHSSATTAAYLALQLDVGSVVSEVAVKYRDPTGVGGVLFELFVLDNDFAVPATNPGAATLLATVTSPAIAAYNVALLTPGTPRTLGPGDSLWVKVSAFVASTELFAGKVKYLPVIS